MNFLKLDEKFIYQHKSLGSEIFRFLSKYSEIVHIWESHVVISNSGKNQL